MIVVYVPTSDREEAYKIAEALLEEKLVACANIMPSESMYWWDGRIEMDKEVILIMKTKKSNYDKIKSKVEELHSYDIANITYWEADANEAYKNWLMDELKK